MDLLQGESQCDQMMCQECRQMANSERTRKGNGEAGREHSSQKSWTMGVCLLVATPAKKKKKNRHQGMYRCQISSIYKDFVKRSPSAFANQALNRRYPFCKSMPDVSLAQCAHCGRLGSQKQRGVRNSLKQNVS